MYNTLTILSQEGKTAADVAKENKNYKIAKKLDKTKSLWHFSRKKGASVDDQATGLEADKNHLYQHYDSQDGMSSQEESDLDDYEENASRADDEIYD